MAEEEPLQKLVPGVLVMRVIVIILSCLLLIPAALSLDGAQKGNDPVGTVPLVAGELIATAIMALLVQFSFITIDCCSAKPCAYKPAGLTHLCFQAIDTLVNYVLLAGYTAGGIGAVVVAAQLAQTDTRTSEDEENKDVLSNTMINSAAFCLLLVVELIILCITNCGILYSLMNKYSKSSRHTDASNKSNHTDDAKSNHTDDASNKSNHTDDASSITKV